MVCHTEFVALHLKREKPILAGESEEFSVLSALLSESSLRWEIKAIVLQTLHSEGQKQYLAAFGNTLGNPQLLSFCCCSIRKGRVMMLNYFCSINESIFCVCTFISNVRLHANNCHFHLSSPVIRKNKKNGYQCIIGVEKSLTNCSSVPVNGLLLHAKRTHLLMKCVYC